MAAFLQDFTITQSNDCKTISLADNSTFGSNDEGYTFGTFDTKTISIYDSLDTLLFLLSIIDSTAVTFPATKDNYYKIVYLLQQGSDDPLIKIKTKALSCFTELKYGEAVTFNCNCSKEVNDQLFQISKGLKSAQIFASRGNGVSAQDMLDFSSSYANDCKDTFSNDGDCGCTSK